MNEVDYKKHAIIFSLLPKPNLNRIEFYICPRCNISVVISLPSTGTPTVLTFNHISLSAYGYCYGCRIELEDGKVTDICNPSEILR